MPYIDIDSPIVKASTGAATVIGGSFAEAIANKVTTAPVTDPGKTVEFLTDQIPLIQTVPAETINTFITDTITGSSPNLLKYCNTEIGTPAQPTIVDTSKGLVEILQEGIQKASDFMLNPSGISEIITKDVVCKPVNALVKQASEWGDLGALTITAGISSTIGNLVETATNNNMDNPVVAKMFRTAAAVLASTGINALISQATIENPQFWHFAALATAWELVTNWIPDLLEGQSIISEYNKPWAKIVGGAALGIYHLIQAIKI